MTGHVVALECLSKVAAVKAIGAPVKSIFLQAPHCASSAGRPGAMRLTLEQCGQTTWSGSVTGDPRAFVVANVGLQAPFHTFADIKRSLNVREITNS